MDHIFGTFATDELKVVHHRASRRGIQHMGMISPLDPKPGEAVEIRVRVGSDTSIDQIVCYYTVDGSIPVGNRGAVVNGAAIRLEHVGVEWDSITWGYVAWWHGVIPAQPDNTTVRYVISGWAEAEPEVFADYPNVQRTAEQAAGAFFKGEEPPTEPPGDPLAATVFSYRVDTLTLPDWVPTSIWYHIFVDRFYPGDGKSWIQTDDLNGIVGGTLWGVCDKLDYLCDLGINAIWLSPIWIAPSHHGYDVIDYMQIEPRYGGTEALKALVDAAHARGIRVVLDLVCNHISHLNPMFAEALHDRNSRYRSWFTFDDSELGYRSFFGVKDMPQVNLDNPEARAWMIDIARHWIRECGVDGYRLDYANGPSLDFWTDFRAAVHAEKPDVFLFGEIVDSPGTLRSYVGHLDGCLDFYASETLRKAYGWKAITAADADRMLKMHNAHFPPDFCLPTFIDNHDMDRFLVIAQGDKDALRRVAIAQMRQPAPPVIFYGTEVGLSQRKPVHGNGLHMSREPMLWGDEQDQELLSEYKRLIAERKELR